MNAPRRPISAGKTPSLLLTFYGDDFTGSTDALEQLTLAGVKTVLFIEPPSAVQLKAFPGLQAIGVAGTTRALPPKAMEKELRPALQKLKALGARHVHYKVCSTFDSSPQIGSIGRVIDVAAKIFRAPFVPLLVSAPMLGRYTVFGNHFARFGIGSGGEIHRLDRHPAISHHPVTPMLEANLRLHLAKQTRKKIALFDILNVTLPEDQSRAALDRVLAERPDVVLFDALDATHLKRIGGLMDSHASRPRPLFSVGSSGIEMALTSFWSSTGMLPRVQPMRAVDPVDQVLIVSGSCSPVTLKQISWALKHGFAKVPVNAAALVAEKSRAREMRRAIKDAGALLRVGRSIIVHTTRSRISATPKDWTALASGMALGKIMREILNHHDVRRVCIAGGDTSSFAALALSIEALEMIAPLTPGAPLCRAQAPGSPVNGREIVFKGGQVGAENYFQTVLKGNT